MSRLISMEDAIRAIEEEWDGCCSEYPATQIIYDTTEAIERLPIIQPEIVRCKDCKYAEYIDDVQTLWCTECGQGRTVAPNDFCSYAERREVNNESN